MGLLMPNGENTEKAGLLMENAAYPERKTDLEMLEQIDAKLGLLLAAGEKETEG